MRRLSRLLSDDSGSTFQLNSDRRFSQLNAADRLAVAAHVIGRDDESTDARTRAHKESLRSGNLPDAATEAFWLGLLMMLRGDMAQNSGWLARA